MEEIFKYVHQKIIKYKYKINGLFEEKSNLHGQPVKLKRRLLLTWYKIYSYKAYYLIDKKQCQQIGFTCFLNKLDIFSYTF